jgi:DNA/RNA-binding protein KIN17
MGKAEKGTPKDIAKRIKAKGLQKLKFWCQVCEKQCRDANGFKCHLTSESHLRQIKLFSEQSTGRLNSYSREFEANFLATLRTRHTTTEVNANNVYQEVIQDRTHVHMNSTIWATLGDFVKYLGRTGKCHVRETERGWYVSYIEQDAARLAMRVTYEQRHEAEQEAERLERERTDRQRVEAAKALDRIHVDQKVKPTELDPNREATVKVKIDHSVVGGNGKRKPADASDGAKSNVFGGGDDDESDDEEDDNGGGPPPGVLLPPSFALKPSSASAGAPGTAGPARSKREGRETNHHNNINSSAHDHHQQSAPASRAHASKLRDDQHSSSWLLPDILVRILDKKSQFYDRKAVVNRVNTIRDDDNKGSPTEEEEAQLTILDTGRERNDGGQQVAIRASKLETVVPKEGKQVRVLREGRHRGKGAVVVSRNDRKSRATLKLEGSGEVLERVPYDDFAKAA